MTASPVCLRVFETNEPANGERKWRGAACAVAQCHQKGPMKKYVVAGMGVCVSMINLLGQGVDPLAPSAITPKAMPRPLKSEPAHSPRSGEDNPYVPGNTNLFLKGIIIVKSADEISPNGVPDMRGVVVKDVPVLQARDFMLTMEMRFLGRPITEYTIRDLQDAIILYCREKGKLVIDVIMPE